MSSFQERLWLEFNTLHALMERFMLLSLLLHPLRRKTVDKLIASHQQSSDTADPLSREQVNDMI